MGGQYSDRITIDRIKANCIYSAAIKFYLMAFSDGGQHEWWVPLGQFLKSVRPFEARVTSSVLRRRRRSLRRETQSIDEPLNHLNSLRHSGLYLFAQADVTVFCL